MADHHRVHPLVRAYGKARIEITRQANNEQEWQKHWRAPQNPFSFRWGSTWKQCVEYKVEDFASEVGFFIDLLGFPVDTFSPCYTRLTTPDEDFYFAISEVRPGEQATPAEALRLQFCVLGLEELIQQLESRGISIEGSASQESTGYKVASFRTPHGISIDLVDLTDGEMDPDEINEKDAEAEAIEIEDINDSPDDDQRDDTGGKENDILIEAPIDPVELALSQGDDVQEEDYLTPFTRIYPGQQKSSAARRPRVRSAPRVDNYNFDEIRRMPPRDGQPGKNPSKPRSNGEITYVEIEGEDEI